LKRFSVHSDCLFDRLLSRAVLDIASIFFIRTARKILLYQREILVGLLIQDTSHT
jgi:hypothetical protein